MREAIVFSPARPSRQRGEDEPAPTVRGSRQRVGLLHRELALEVLDLLAQVLAFRLQRARSPPGRSAGSTDKARTLPATASRSDAEARQRASAAQERHPRAAAEPLRRGDRDDADGAGARHVRAAARGQIEVLDVDQTQRPLALRFLAEPSDAASSADAKRMLTGRSSQTTRLASSSARAISPALTSRARSIVE